MSNFSLQQLTEGIRDRHIGTEGKRLVEKWSRTGLLRGLEGTKRENMSRLLENQAAQVLREANTLGTGAGAGTASGDLRGFTNIAFPIVRRVFGGLVANDLVSVQPMSLPSGLLFYLDYTYGSDVGGNGAGKATYKQGQSIYNSPAGKGIQSGSLAVGGQYDLAGSGFTKVHTSSTGETIVTGGSFNVSTALNTITDGNVIATSGADARFLQFDPQILQQIEDGEQDYQFAVVVIEDSTFDNADLTMIKDFALHTTNGTVSVVAESVQSGDQIHNVRRLNQLGTYATNVFTPNPLATNSTANRAVLMVVPVGSAQTLAAATTGISFAISATLDNTAADGTSLVIPAFESSMTASGGGTPVIPEIDIKVEAISVTADTRK